MIFDRLVWKISDYNLLAGFALIFHPKGGVHCNVSVNERTQHIKLKLNLIGRRGEI